MEEWVSVWRSVNESESCTQRDYGFPLKLSVQLGQNNSDVRPRFVTMEEQHAIQTGLSV